MVPLATGSNWIPNFLSKITVHIVSGNSSLLTRFKMTSPTATFPFSDSPAASASMIRDSQYTASL